MEFICKHIKHGKDSGLDLGNKPCVSLENELSLPRDSSFRRKYGVENAT